ncbi:GtrA family protein [Stenotrophomonas sp. P2112]|uniref:GtrA family protein n=1 Tax=Stenotrophomonas TaxID=40323 RepID=UPI0013DF25EA|nr:GtrA family protein [Stenotrophomonas pavanii]NGM54446.1 GtrA family protein [Stenotrophomonas pavanii]
MSLRASLPTIVRFLAGGALNTGSTFVLYWLLLLVVEYRIAYAISFVAGILLSYVINTKFVFRTNYSLRKVILFPLVYLATYLAGAVVLDLSVSRFGVDARLAPFISICATLPLTYLLSKLVLAGSHTPAQRN